MYYNLVHFIYRYSEEWLYVLDTERGHGRSPAVWSISDLLHGYPAVSVTRDVIAQHVARSLCPA